MTGPDGQGLTELDPGDAEYIVARAINDQGDVGGMAFGRPGRAWQIDKFVFNLPEGASFTTAIDINDRRQVVVAGTWGYIVCPTENCE